MIDRQRKYDHALHIGGENEEDQKELDKTRLTRPSQVEILKTMIRKMEKKMETRMRET